MKFGVLGIVIGFGFLLGIKVIQVSVELVKTMCGRQVLIPVTQVVFAKLPGHIAVVLQQIGKCRCPVRGAVL